MSSYMVLGGCGFIGRNIVCYLESLDTCESIIVVDKSRPELSWLTPAQKRCFENPKVTFHQANLANAASVSKVFSASKCEYVINAAAETRLKMSSGVYEEHIFKLGLNCAEHSAAAGVKMFVQLSSARVSSIPKSKEKGDHSTTEVLKCQLKLEQKLKEVSGLNYTIVRPALVYGSGDKRGLTPLLILGGIYKKLSETMKLLWTKDVPINTVHVEDVVRACVHLATLGKSGHVWDLADKCDSTQGSIAELVSQIFCIKHAFEGSIKSTLAKNFFEDVIDDINHKHMVPWSEACTSEDIQNTPLSPYVTEEQLILEDIKVDGSKIESTGFIYKHPKLVVAELKTIIDEYIEQKLYPKSCMP